MSIRTLRTRKDGRTTSTEKVPAQKHELYHTYMLDPEVSFPNRNVDRLLRFELCDNPIWDTDKRTYKYCAGGDLYFFEDEIMRVEEVESRQKAATENKRIQTAKRKARAQEEHKRKLLNSKRRKAEDPVVFLKKENTMLKKMLKNAEEKASQQKIAKEKAMRRISALEKQICQAEDTSSSSSSSSSSEYENEQREHELKAEIKELQQQIKFYKKEAIAVKQKFLKSTEKFTLLNGKLGILKQKNQELLAMIKDLRKQKTKEKLEANRLALQKAEKANETKLQIERLKLLARQEKLSNVKKEAYHAGKYGKANENFHNRKQNHQYNNLIGRSRNLSTVRNIIPSINASGQYTPRRSSGFDPRQSSGFDHRQSSGFDPRRTIVLDHDDESAGSGFQNASQSMQNASTEQNAPTLQAAIQPLMNLLQSLQQPRQQPSTSNINVQASIEESLRDQDDDLGALTASP